MRSEAARLLRSFCLADAGRAATESCLPAKTIQDRQGRHKHSRLLTFVCSTRRSAYEDTGITSRLPPLNRSSPVHGPIDRVAKLRRPECHDRPQRRQVGANGRDEVARESRASDVDGCDPVDFLWGHAHELRYDWARVNPLGAAGDVPPKVWSDVLKDR
jgi:hypothetical protein